MQYFFYIYSVQAVYMLLYPVYHCLYDFSNWKAKQWVTDFLHLGKHLEGHQRKYVTPYM